MEHLANLAPEDVFRLAISRSRHAPSVLAKHMGVSESFLRRVTSAEKYFPSYEDIPAFCDAVGNTLVIDWQFARVSFTHQSPLSVTCGFLHTQVLSLAKELGHVSEKIITATADNRISKAENRTILKEVLDLLEAATQLAGALRAHDKKVVRHGA